MSQRYISAAAVADLVMPLGSDSETLHWRAVAIVLGISATQKPPNVGDEKISMKFCCRVYPEGIIYTICTSLLSFSELIWKNTAEDEEILPAELLKVLWKNHAFILQKKIRPM